PDTVVVSGASGPYVAYRPSNAEAYLYRKTVGHPFELAMEGLPDARGTIASRFATHPDEPGVFYAANNHGLFSSQDAGRSWKVLKIAWPDGIFAHGVDALVAFEE
ncbi:MAG: glycosyl hydrolase, partial [Chloroflexi bacterium]|nr:glycosyl hydrolase [Chloroflexota bacterium]